MMAYVVICYHAYLVSRNCHYGVPCMSLYPWSTARLAHCACGSFPHVIQQFHHDHPTITIHLKNVSAEGGVVNQYPLSPVMPFCVSAAGLVIYINSHRCVLQLYSVRYGNPAQFTL